MRYLTGCLLCLAVSGCLLTGCKAAGPQSFEDAMQLVDKAREVAKEQGVAWSAEVEFAGKPNVYEHVSFGVDTGLSVRLRFQGNAAGE